MNYLPRIGVANHNGRVVADTRVRSDGVAARKLCDRVIGGDRENENGRAILDLNKWQGDLALTEPGVVEPENQPVPRALDNRFENDLAIGKRVILNRSVALVNSAEVNVALTMRRGGRVRGSLSAPARVLRAFARCRVRAFPPRPVRRRCIVLGRFLFTRRTGPTVCKKTRHGDARLTAGLGGGGGANAR